MSLRAIVFVSVIGIGGCSGESLGTSNMPPDLKPGETAPADLASTDGSSPDMAPCLTDGDFSFFLTADGLSVWNGKPARAVAYEPGSPAIGLPDRQPANYPGVIDNGTFVASCRNALRANNEYPSIAVFVDVDGDGVCGVGDVGAYQQFFAWDANSVGQDPLHLPAESAQGWHDVSILQGRVGSNASTFCGAFFP